MGTDASATLLFSYDTLRDPGVQLDTFGRVLDGDEDVLPGYAVDYLEFEDHRDVPDRTAMRHAVLRPTGSRLDKVLGRVLNVTDDELDACDEYESPQYRRRTVTLASGREAWVYVIDLPSG